MKLVLIKSGLVINVCYIIFRGPSFRKAFKKLSELVCIFPSPNTVHLAMTATATPAAIKELIDDLQFTDVTTVAVNPDRANITLEVHNRTFLMFLVLSNLNI
jgi:superfamily II DNA helicase RecQ